MSRIAKYLPVLAILGAVSFAGVVAAQTEPTTTPSSPPSPNPATTKMTVAEMQSGILTLEAKIQEDSRRIMHLKEVTTQAKDVIKLSCINDKLVQLKAQMNIWDANKLTFQAALSKTDDDRVAAYTSLTGVAKEITTLREKADACVGGPELFKQESGVSVTHPPFPDDPTVGDPFEPSINDIEPPGYASPFL